MYDIFFWMFCHVFQTEVQNVAKCVLWLDWFRIFWILNGMEIDGVERKIRYCSWTKWHDFYIKWQTWRHWRTFSVVTSRQRCHGPGIALYMFSFYTWSNQSYALWFCDILLQLKLIACNHEKQSGWLVRWQRATFNREIRDSNVSQAIPVKRNFIFLTLSANSGIVLWNVSRPPSSLTTPHNLCRWNVV